MGGKIKQKLFIGIAVMSIFMTTLAPFSTVNADSDAKSRSAIQKGVDDYLDNEEDTAIDLYLKFADEKVKDLNADRDTIKYVLHRTFTPMYINDVRSGTLSKKYKDAGIDPRYDEKHVCNPNEPNNLLNHNCNIPNFAAEIGQESITASGDIGIIGAERTSAKSSTGFGVPKVPGGKVPVNPKNRKQGYTALEVFGYDVSYTDYIGEWDKISKSSKARTLSSIGSLDNVRAVGAGVWEGLKSGLGGFITGFSFNPIRWAGNVVDATVSGTFNSIIDTHELNVVAGNKWVRDELNNTLYGVYVLTDKEVILESAQRYMRNYTKQLSKAADDNPELQEVMELESAPDFEFIENKETEKSKKKRDKIKKENEEIKKEAEEKGKKPKLKKVPEPVYMTEAEQLEEWAEDNKDFLKRAKAKNLIGDIKKYETYDELTEEWGEKWQSYADRTFDANYDVVKEMVEDLDIQYFIDDPFSDPKQPISHYVCADSMGKPMRAKDGSYEYVYEKYNEGDKEFVNPKCKGGVRPPISEGYYGSGWHVDRNIDTRHVSNFKQSALRSSSILSGAGISLGKRAMKVSTFITKVVNSILGLSFNPILEELGISEIVEATMEGFRDTIFFPLSVLAAAFGAVMLMLRVLQNGSARHFLVTILSILIVFVFGSAFLIRPSKTINLIEKVPNKVDNVIVDILLAEPEGASMCSAGGKGGVRTAQCNLWSATVFQPWVYGQFGTSYNNLYAKGYAPEGGKSVRNTNGKLVGNAEVDLGGGEIVNNWALYQLSLMKSGTITSEDKSKPLGVVDPNMYKVVDMQAGPDNGKGTDSRFIEDWSGISSTRFLASMLGMIQSIFIMSSIGFMGIMKVEYSLLFAIGLLILPIELLRALTPSGVLRFPQYLAKMLALFMKRILIVIMLAVSLKTINVVYSTGVGFLPSAMLTIILGTAFKMYRDELLSLVDEPEGGIMSGSPRAIKEAFERTIPLKWRNDLTRFNARVKGKIGGFIGGALYGSTMYSDNKKHAKEHNENLSRLVGEGVLEYDEAADKFIKPSRGRLSTMLYQGVKGAETASSAAEKSIDTSIRRTGFSFSEVYDRSKDSVYKKGQDDLEHGRDSIYREVFYDASKKSEHGHYYGKPFESLTEEDREILKDPEVQKAIRIIADEKRKAAKEGKMNSDGMTTEDLAKMLDSKRVELISRKMKQNPIKAAEIVKAQARKDELNRGRKHNIDSSTRSAFVRFNESKVNEYRAENEHAEDVAKELEKAIIKSNVKDGANEIVEALSEAVKDLNEMRKGGKDE